MKNIELSLLACGLLFVAVNVNAQDSTKTKKLNEVIIRTQQKSSKIDMLNPIKKELIGSRELLKAACCNLSESFETTPSVDVAFTDAISGYKQIQMLGLAGPNTLITRENIPDARGLAAITGLTFTPGTWIESMQLSKGTGSVVNGFEGLAGQINVEWKKPFEPTEELWNLNLYQSTQGRSEANIIHRIKLTEKLSTNFFIHAKSQWLKVDQNKDGFLDQPLGKQFIGANRWFWFAPKGWEMQADIKGTYVDNTGGQIDYKKGGEQAPGNPWGYQLNLQQYEGWAKIGKVFTNKPATSIGLQLSTIFNKQDAMYGNRNYNAKEKSFYANLIYQSILGNTNHVIKVGASTLIDNYNETFITQNFKRNELVPGVFAEYAFNTKKLNIVAGLRGDYHNLFGGFVTPRLHIRYAPFPRTSFRASIGRAQRTANIFAENMGYMASNRMFVIQFAELGKAYGLNPEVAWNYGLNFTKKFQIDYRDGSFSVDYYYTHFQNQIVTDIEDPHSVKFYNLKGQSFANSFQAQFDYELIHHLDLRLAYRWYDVQTTYNGDLKENPLIAPHRAFINLDYQTRKKWKFDVTVQWISAKRIPFIDSISETTSSAFVMVNAQISKSWKDDFFEVYLGAENLTNYMQPHPIIGAENPFGNSFDASLIWGPAMGRNIYAGIRMKIR